MLKKVLAAAVLVGAAGGLTAVPAHADPTACYSVYVQVNDQVASQAGCLP